MSDVSQGGGQSGDAGLNTYSGVWGEAQVLHLLRRAMFGVTHADRTYFSTLTLQQSLDVLLTQPVMPLPPENRYNDASYTDPDVAEGETWVFCPFSDDNGEADTKRLESIRSWWIGLLLNQSRSLAEKMTLFWHNRVTASHPGTRDARSFYSYLAPLQRQSLGNFKKLILEVTSSIGMLEYLNGNESRAEAPNENYSRELQELFTIGHGAGEYFTQQDVVAAARVLTGWTSELGVFYYTHAEPEPALKIIPINQRPDPIRSIFHAPWHDTGDKQFSPFYDNKVIKGKSGHAGAEETRELIDLIFSKRDVALHICRSLYRWFVYSDIDSVVEATIIGPLADTFIENDFEVIPVLRRLLGSEHFFAAANMGCHLKNPVDHLIGFCRQFDLAAMPDAIDMKYKAWYKLSQILADLSMAPGYPPNVAGWPAYYLSPAYYELWINSDSIVQRDMVIERLLSDAGGNLPGHNDINLRLDIVGFTAGCADPADVDRLVADSTALLSPVRFDDRQIKYLKNLLTAEDDKDIWSSIWTALAADMNNARARKAVMARLRPYYQYILQQGECQLI